MRDSFSLPCSPRILWDRYRGVISHRKGAAALPSRARGRARENAATGFGWRLSSTGVGKRETSSEGPTSPPVEEPGHAGDDEPLGMLVGIDSDAACVWQAVKKKDGVSEPAGLCDTCRPSRVVVSRRLFWALVLMGCVRRSGVPAHHTSSSTCHGPTFHHPLATRRGS